MNIERKQPVEKFTKTSFQERLQNRERKHGIKRAVELLTLSDREEQYDRLEGMIGRTPLLQFDAPNGSKIIAKVESENPTESHYDRVYVKTLRELEERGIITPGDDLYEVTSGSAGISFAWACDRLGYNAHIYVPSVTPVGRSQEIVNLGADLIQTAVPSIPEASKIQQREFIRAARSRGLRPKIHDTEDGMFHLISAISDEEQQGMHMLNHSENHFTHHSVEEIGAEVIAALGPDTEIDFFISMLGNGTNTRGVTDGLKQTHNSVKVIGVEAYNQPVQFVTKYPGRYEEKYGHAPAFDKQLLIGSSQRGTQLSFMDPDMLDEIRLVSEKQWRGIQEKYNKTKPIEETIGRTSAASLAIAEELDKENPSSVILVLFYDKSDRYDTLVEPKTV